MTDHTFETSPRLKARIAGVFYLLTFLTRGVALFVRGRLSLVAGLIAGACYIAVTLLFYSLFKPVNRSLSLLAAFFSLVRSEEHTSELQSPCNLVCRLLLEKKKNETHA